jgi:2-oxoglutarate ferredoxin oxidoreductase subunit beta
VVTGIFRSTTRPTYDDAVRAQTTTARERKPLKQDSLQSLLNGQETWTIG